MNAIPSDIDRPEDPPHTLRARRLGIDTLRESIVYMRSDSHVCRAEGFRSQARIEVRADGKRIVATLNVVESDLLHHDQIGLSEAAWRLLGVPEGTEVRLAHSLPVESMSDVRAKVYGNRLDKPALERIVRDIADGRYSELEIATFIGACAGDRLDIDETVALTQAICEAQGGMHRPPRARHQHAVRAAHSGEITRFDNRRLARVAKLAGAPDRPAAGVTRDATLGAKVERGDALFTIHAEAPGELAYALQYVGATPDIVMVQ